MPDREITIVGGGPAGLFCAIHAAGTGNRVTVFEKNASCGAKLLLSGSGQCNITHTGDTAEFLTHYGNHGGFLKPALHALGGRDIVAFFERRGLPMQAEPGGKIFPVSRRAADVLSVMVRECERNNVVFRLHEPVREIARTGNHFCLRTDTALYPAEVVVITTGGASYPRCGTTGDGYRLAAALGQPVTETAPALTPLIISAYPFADLAGISFEHLRFSVWRNGRKISEHRGDVLFTHRGLSGPGILDASRGILAGDIIRLSFTGQTGKEAFTAGLLRMSAENPRARVGALLSGYGIPDRLRQVLLRITGIPASLTGAHLPAPLRSRLAENCTGFPLTVAAPGDYRIAMVTRGGISLEGVNRKTMESKIVPGLFFAGEVLDIDGDTGGYNLQAAFSTGYLAAQGIRKRLSDNRAGGEGLEKSIKKPFNLNLR